MIDIQHGTLRPFEEQALAVADVPVEKRRRVANQRTQALGDLPVAVVVGDMILAVEQIEGLQDLDLLVEESVVDLLEVFEPHEVAEANTTAAGFILVARSNATRRGADGDAARTV